MIIQNVLNLERYFLLQKVLEVWQTLVFVTKSVKGFNFFCIFENQNIFDFQKYKKKKLMRCLEIPHINNCLKFTTPQFLEYGINNGKLRNFVKNVELLFNFF